MKVRDLHLEHPHATTPDESLADAADRMRFYEIGSLAVLEGHHLVAIITERDIVRAAAEGSDLGRVPVRLYMTSEPANVDVETDVREAAELMLTLGVRHLPAMDDGRIVGMVSIRDLLTAEMERGTVAGR